jgi:hypothetical protein
MRTPSAATRYGVVELRQYTLRPGRRDTLVDLFEREFIAPQQAEGIGLIGPFRDLDDDDRFVWWRGYADMPARARALQAFYGGPVWLAHRDAANATMLDSNDVLLLRPLNGPAGDEPLVVPAAGVLLVTVCRLPASADPVAGGWVARALRAAAVDDGVAAVGLHVTEPAPNNFPRLPVREGENVLLWCTPFPNRAACDRHERARAASPAWRQWLAGLPDPPTPLRLAPTPHARLRY